jgi:hypothetical protein
MNFSKKLFYALGISIGFLILHILIASFKMRDLATLILTILAMVIAQVLAFLLLKNNMVSRPLTFKDIFFMLSLTMTVSVILLALNSAYNPYTEYKPLYISEILISILVFSGGFSLIITAIIWFTIVKKIFNRS